MGTDGYRVPARKKFLGTDGYRVPAREKILGTGYRENFHLCRPLVEASLISLLLEKIKFYLLDKKESLENFAYLEKFLVKNPYSYCSS